jgi:hypothetical protein
MRTHLSKAGIIKLHEVEQTSDIHSTIGKPNGFWYSVEEDWERWCRSELPDWLVGRTQYEVELGEENILKLCSVRQIKMFHDQYSITCSGQLCKMPEWVKVAQEYDGIEIAPYQWNLRMNDYYFWYYPWDCASGCIWRPKGTSLKIKQQVIV